MPSIESKCPRCAAPVAFMRTTRGGKIPTVPKSIKPGNFIFKAGRNVAHSCNNFIAAQKLPPLPRTNGRLIDNNPIEPVHTSNTEPHSMGFCEPEFPPNMATTKLGRSHRNLSWQKGNT